MLQRQEPTFDAPLRREEVNTLFHQRSYSSLFPYAESLAFCFEQWYDAPTGTMTNEFICFS